MPADLRRFAGLPVKQRKIAAIAVAVAAEQLQPVAVLLRAAAVGKGRLTARLGIVGRQAVVRLRDEIAAVRRAVAKLARKGVHLARGQID